MGQPPLAAPDIGMLVLLAIVVAWAVVEHWRSRGIRGTQVGQARRRVGATILLVGLEIGYVGRLLGASPWISRPLILAGVVLLALGYRSDRKSARDG